MNKIIKAVQHLNQLYICNIFVQTERIGNAADKPVLIDFEYIFAFNFDVL